MKKYFILLVLLFVFYAADQIKKQQFQDKAKGNQFNLEKWKELNFMEQNANYFIEPKTAFKFNTQHYGCPVKEYGYLLMNTTTMNFTVAAAISYSCPQKIKNEGGRNVEYYDTSILIKFFWNFRKRSAVLHRFEVMKNEDFKKIVKKKFAAVLGENNGFLNIIDLFTHDIRYRDEIGVVYNNHILSFYFNSKLFYSIQTGPLFEAIQEVVKDKKYYVKTSK